ncbi:MAG: type II toxin-antitoxin system VapC family toxin [Dermatophilus congolensis]|nr:type II toxin-antitoxin system VapC family toxin [Dermatophilus congolensis]
MIVDSSAIIAILWDETDGARLTEVILNAPDPRMSAASFIECGVVIDRRGGPASEARFLQIFGELGIGLEPVTIEQSRIGREAHRRFGAGSGHPARLNFGDCFSYALSAATGKPLLFKGRDFGATDVSVVDY